MKSEKLSKEKNEKIFTKSEKNIIISKDYNPLNEEQNKVQEREGLFMKGNVLNAIKKLSKKYNKKEMLIKKMFEKCNELGFNMQDSLDIINEFYI